MGEKNDEHIALNDSVILYAIRVTEIEDHEVTLSVEKGWILESVIRGRFPHSHS